MKITKIKLKQLIREEIQLLKEKYGPNDVRDELDGFGKTDVSSNEAHNDSIGYFTFKGGTVFYSNWNFSEDGHGDGMLGPKGWKKYVENPLKSKGVRFQTTNIETDAELKFKNNDLSKVIDILKKTVGNL
jgi:hypothetical protein|tara:strand:- start:1349 stop:1738 length:390 start_codon:yes stop_codon:yes gene_type:complete